MNLGNGRSWKGREIKIFAHEQTKFLNKHEAQSFVDKYLYIYLFVWAKNTDIFHLRMKKTVLFLNSQVQKGCKTKLYVNFSMIEPWEVNFTMNEGGRVGWMRRRETLFDCRPIKVMTSSSDVSAITTLRSGLVSHFIISSSRETQSGRWKIYIILQRVALPNRFVWAELIGPG